ncbi:MAG: HEAT repeat domain-containing protein [Planctomycetota bacterium]|nr:HEAT repeat domain-containing protein [Planctomycetota bacterium]
MRRFFAFIVLLVVGFGLFSLRTDVRAEQVDEEAMKEHVYAMNKSYFKSEDWLERAGVCERIGNLNVPEYASDIVPLMKDTHPLVRLSAIRGVGAAGNPQYITDIAEYCVSLGRTVEDRLFATNCGWALGQLDKEKGAEALLAKAEGKDGAKMAVAAALGYIGGTKASNGLAPLLDSGKRDRDEELFAVAIRSAGKLETDLPEQHMFNLMQDDKTSTNVKMAILSCIRNRHVENAVDPLLDVIGKNANQGDELMLYNNIAWTIGQFKVSSNQLRKIMILANKGNSDVKIALLRAFLGPMGEGNTENFDVFLKDRQPHVRSAALNVLANHPDKSYERDLFRILKSDRVRFVRYFAALALAKLDDEGVKNKLLDMADRAREDEEAARLFEAISICGKPEDAQRLVEYIKKKQEKDEVKFLLAAMALSDINENEGTRLLVEMLNGEDEKDRNKAAKSLRFFPTSVSVEALISKLPDEYERNARGAEAEFHRSVLYTLERITGHRFRPTNDIWTKWWEFYQKVQKNKDIIEASKREKKSKMRRDHNESIKFFGGSGESEKSVEMGLYWLARFQMPRGSWDAIKYPELGNLPGDVPAMEQCDVAMTGLSLLSFSTAGYTHKYGKYADVYERGLEWLVGFMKTDGMWRYKQISSHGDGEAYEQATATMAVLEAYTMTREESLEVFCQSAVDLIQATQNILLGWRYFTMPKSNDSSVTGWYILSLKTAIVDGFRVFDKCFEGAIRWYESVSEKIDEFETPDLRETKYFDNFVQKIYQKCGSGYDDVQPLAAMTAIALISRRFMGYKRTHPQIRAYANYLKDWDVSFEQATGARNLNFAFYFIYYATLANFQMGADYWREWNEKLIRNVVQVQEADISSDFYGSWGAGKSKKGTKVGSAVGAIRGGRIYCTTMMILTLEIYYRYNPMLEENEIIIE